MGTVARGDSGADGNGSKSRDRVAVADGRRDRLDDAGTDSMVYIFPRISAQSYPVVWGNIGIYFKVTTVSGDTDSLSVWFKTKRRLTNSTFVNCANDSFIVFDELDWTSGAYYCWPDQDSNPILFGPCDGIVIYWRYTDTGASDDSCRVVPFVTGQ